MPRFRVCWMMICVAASCCGGCVTDHDASLQSSGFSGRTTQEPDPARWDQDGVPWHQRELEEADWRAMEARRR